MNERELWWIAGLFEGEGWFGVNKRTIRDKEYLNPGVALQMVDADIVYQLPRLIGAGTIHKKLLPSGKISYYYSLSGAKAIEFMRKVYLLMGTRRQGQINQAFVMWEEKGKPLIKKLDLDDFINAV